MIWAAVLHTWLRPRDFSMIWAAFNLAYIAFLRCSKFTYKGVYKFRPSLTFHPNLAHPQRMTVYLKSSKTDISREGHSLPIACTLSPLCAIVPMQEYFLLDRLQPGPLFYFQSGHYLTQGVVSNLFRDGTRVAGLPYRSLKGHSFCIGMASVAAATGLPDWLIKVLGCWSSDCYQLYIRTPQFTFESVAFRMAAASGCFSPV